MRASRPHRDSLVGGRRRRRHRVFTELSTAVCVQYRSDLRPNLGWLGITLMLTLTCPQDRDQIRLAEYTGAPLPLILRVPCIIVGFASPGLTSTAPGRSFNQLTSAVPAAQKLFTASPCWLLHQHRPVKRPHGDRYEQENVPAEQPQAREDPRLPPPHAYACGSCDPVRSSVKGSREALGVVRPFCLPRPTGSREARTIGRRYGAGFAPTERIRCSTSASVPTRMWCGSASS